MRLKLCMYVCMYVVLLQKGQYLYINEYAWMVLCTFQCTRKTKATYVCMYVCMYESFQNSETETCWFVPSKQKHLKTQNPTQTQTRLRIRIRLRHRIQFRLRLRQWPRKAHLFIVQHYSQMQLRLRQWPRKAEKVILKVSIWHCRKRWPVINVALTVHGFIWQFTLTLKLMLTLTLTLTLILFLQPETAAIFGSIHRLCHSACK